VRPAADAALRTTRSDRRAALAGFAARWPAVRFSSSVSDGTGSPSHSIGSNDQGESGLGSVNSLSMITPAAPSIVAWWNFVSIAQRPSPRPSMTYTSHSGWRRSIGRPMMRATCSANWSAAPGGASPIWRTW
jgi:hypothetical protein